MGGSFYSGHHRRIPGKTKVKIKGLTSLVRPAIKQEIPVRVNETGILDWVKNVFVINLTYNRSGTFTPGRCKGYHDFSTKYFPISNVTLIYN